MRRIIALFMSLLVGVFLVASVTAERAADYGIIGALSGHHTSFIALSRATDDVYSHAQAAEVETTVLVGDSRSKRPTAALAARGHWLCAVSLRLNKDGDVRPLALQVRVCASPGATYPLRI